jgi:hypothetical protein
VNTRSEQASLLRRWRALIYSPDGPANPEARFVAITIAEYIDWTSFTTIVGVLSIAKATGYCEKTVRTRVQELIRGGWLSARRTGYGRTWKQRELKLEWPVPDTGHATSRPVPLTGLGKSWPVCQSSETGAPFPQDRYEVPPISSDTNSGETNIEISSEGAASPSPAHAGLAALESEEEVAERDLETRAPAPVDATPARPTPQIVRPSELRRLAQQRSDSLEARRERIARIAGAFPEMPASDVAKLARVTTDDVVDFMGRRH